MCMYIPWASNLDRVWWEVYTQTYMVIVAINVFFLPWLRSLGWSSCSSDFNIIQFTTWNILASFSLHLPSLILFLFLLFRAHFPWIAPNNPQISTRSPLRCAMPSNLRVKAVACGGEHTLVLTEHGHVFGCGDNSCGQLALGAIGQRGWGHLGGHIQGWVFDAWNMLKVC